VDEFARRKAASKAIRNALMAVMPADHIAAYMRAAIEGGRVRTIKSVDSEQVPAKEKPKARVGDPPRITSPQPATEESKTEEEPPQEPPRSVDDVTERIAAFLPGHSELVVVSDRGGYYRVGRVKRLDKEIEDHLDFAISEMNGKWDNENNEWRIKKEAKG